MRREEALANLTFDAELAFVQYQNKLSQQLSRRQRKKGVDTTEQQNHINPVNRQTFVNNYIASMSSSTPSNNGAAGHRRAVSSPNCLAPNGEDVTSTSPALHRRTNSASGPPLPFTSPIKGMSDAEKRNLTPAQRKAYMDCNRRLLEAKKQRQEERKEIRQNFKQMQEEAASDRALEIELEYEYAGLAGLDDETTNNAEEQLQPSSLEQTTFASMLSPLASSQLQENVPPSTWVSTSKPSSFVPTLKPLEFPSDGWKVEALRDPSQYVLFFSSLYQAARKMTESEDVSQRKDAMLLLLRFLAFSWQNVRKLLEERLKNQDEAVNFMVWLVTKPGWWNHCDPNWWNANISRDINGLKFFISNVYIPHFRAPQFNEEPVLYHYRMLEEGRLSKLVEVTIDKVHDAQSEPYYDIRQNGTDRTKTTHIDRLQPI